MERIGLFAVIMLAGAASAVEITAPASVLSGAEVAVSVSDGVHRNDFVTIVAPDTPEGTYERYAYARGEVVLLTAPLTPGAYEIRYLAAQSPYETLARAALSVAAATAKLTAPDNVAAGAKFDVQWTGPGNARDFITLVDADAPEGTYDKYTYTKRGPTLTLTAPDAPGAYEIRYLLGDQPYPTIGRRAVEVSGTSASLTVTSPVVEGATVAITWEGPGNTGDFITVVAAGADEGTWEEYVYAKGTEPVELQVPETAGPYEVRYLTGQDYVTLARAPLEIVPAHASVTGPATAEARSVIQVRWEGPGNDGDYVAIHRVDADNRDNAPYAYLRRGPVLRIEVPSEAGDFELRYITGRGQRTLASQPLTVTPRAAPGFLRVVAEQVMDSTDGGQSIAVILDASGSMLQRVDGVPRIALARDALNKLINETLPETVDFGLWVFGHREADSCRSDLEIPLGPLDRSGAAATVQNINAMNLARTPIAATLGKVGTALAGRTGQQLIILVTDGEETCDGDPAATIDRMRASGIDVRVNIVGFAIEELMLRETFAEWAQLGGGQYLDARDATSLANSLTEALQPSFSVQDDTGQTIATGTVGGEAVSVAPGVYQLNTSSGEQAVTIAADEETLVTLGGG